MPDAIITLYWAAVDLYRAMGTTYGLHDTKSPEASESTWIDSDFEEQRGLLVDLDRAIDGFERAGQVGGENYG